MSDLPCRRMRPQMRQFVAPTGSMADFDRRLESGCSISHDAGMTLESGFS